MEPIKVRPKEDRVFEALLVSNTDNDSIQEAIAFCRGGMTEGDDFTTDIIHAKKYGGILSWDNEQNQAIVVPFGHWVVRTMRRWGTMEILAYSPEEFGEIYEKIEP